MIRYSIVSFRVVSLPPHVWKRGWPKFIIGIKRLPTSKWYHITYSVTGIFELLRFLVHYEGTRPRSSLEFTVVKQHKSSPLWTRLCRTSSMRDEKSKTSIESSPKSRSYFIFRSRTLMFLLHSYWMHCGGHRSCQIEDSIVMPSTVPTLDLMAWRDSETDDLAFCNFQRTVLIIQPLSNLVLLFIRPIRDMKRRIPTIFFVLFRPGGWVSNLYTSVDGSGKCSAISP